jgi:hypothetical protein
LGENHPNLVALNGIVKSSPKLVALQPKLVALDPKMVA